MMNSKFTKIADKIVERDKQMFDNLMDFERTRKISTKTRVNFTVDKAIVSRFRKYCREKGYNMSAKVEKAIEEMVE